MHYRPEDVSAAVDLVFPKAEEARWWRTPAGPIAAQGGDTVIKSTVRGGKAKVRFVLDVGLNARSVAVCGEWNGWSADADIMIRDRGGGLSLTLDLEPGRTYRFRYLLDGERWENDWHADAYVPNAFGGEDSLLDLTSPGSRSTPATESRPNASKATTKKAAATKKAVQSKPAIPSNTSTKKTSTKPR